MDWNEQVHPNVEDIVAYLDLLEKQPRQRIVRGCVGGCTVWVKRYDTRRRPVGKLLHEAISPLLTSAVLKASPHVDADGLAKREERKIEAFRAAGFHTPKVLFRKGPVLVLSHEGGSLEGLLNELRRSNAVAHDRLLIKSAEVLAQLHDAGLCHGRPHKRDLLVKDGTWVFLDFEEEPEAVMPLSAAQARDVWLFFFQITHAAIDPDTAKLAFAPLPPGGPRQYSG